LTVRAGLEIESIEVPGIVFRTTEDAVFRGNSDVEVKIYDKQSGTDKPDHFLLTVSVNAYSGTVKTQTIAAPNIPEKY